MSEEIQETLRNEMWFYFRENMETSGIILI